MAFYDRLKESRINAGLTQEQLAEKIGIAKSTLSGYESGNREPAVATIARAMGILKIDANFLYQDEMDALGGNPMQLKYDEMEYIRRYRFLDKFGQETINMVLDREFKRIKTIKEQADRIVELETMSTSVIAIKSKQNTSINDTDTSHFEVAAAHEHTDIEVTDEMRKHDNDIMDDDDF